MNDKNSRQLNSSLSGNRMSVTGRGSITAVPDIAVIRLGVLISGENLTLVQEENARISQMILNVLRQMGVSDIRTQRYNIDKIYDYDNGVRIDRGYSVTNVFEIRTDMLDMAGAIIDAAVDSGANLIEFIDFDVSDTEQYYLEALNIALNNASNKAKSMANELGAMLNALPISIIENSIQPAPFTRTFLGEDQFTTPIEPGTRQIEASVTLEFTYI
jgi:uncharacterized protein YggE